MLAEQAIKNAREVEKAYGAQVGGMFPILFLLL